MFLLPSIISPFLDPLGCDFAQFSRNTEFPKPSTRALAWRQEHEQPEDFNHILSGLQLELNTHMNCVCECDQKNTGNTAASIWIWKGIHFPVGCMGQRLLFKQISSAVAANFSCNSGRTFQVFQCSPNLLTSVIPWVSYSQRRLLRLLRVHLKELWDLMTTQMQKRKKQRNIKCLLSTRAALLLHLLHT